MPLGQSVTVVNKSGVIVKNSKQLADVFKEAKNAYLHKKAELKAGRDADWNEKQARRDFENLRLDDRASVKTSTRKPRDKHHSSRSAANSGANTPRRQRSDEHVPRGGHAESSRRPHHATRGLSDYPYESYPGGRTVAQYEQDLAGPRGLRRSYTDGPVRPSNTTTRSRSFDEIRHSRDSVDMALAYGEMPPPLPVRDVETQMRGKMTKLTRLLEEAHCVQHSATSTIAHLQKNPDALAAVALTLAEMSKIATRMAPGALAGMGKLFPAAMGLLLSPELLIAAGVGVGITVVMLGGYKIVRRIKDKKELDREVETPLQLQEIEPSLSNIEIWRRGIADAEAASVATTADGEFVTPEAGRRLVEEGTIRKEWLKDPAQKEIRRKPVLPKRSNSDRTGANGSRSRRAPTEQSSGSTIVPRSKSRPSRTVARRSPPSEVSVASTKMDGAKTIVKGVKMLFQGKTAAPESGRRTGV